MRDLNQLTKILQLIISTKIDCMLFDVIDELIGDILNLTICPVFYYLYIVTRYKNILMEDITEFCIKTDRKAPHIFFNFPQRVSSKSSAAVLTILSSSDGGR